MSRRRIDNVQGSITDASGITAGATSFHDSVGLAALGAISSPNYAVAVLEPKTANQEVAYIMAYGQEPPLAAQPPQLTTALTSGVAPTDLFVQNGPLYANTNQVRLYYVTSGGTVHTQVYTVASGSTRTDIKLSSPAAANYSYPIGTYVQPIATSTLASGNYGVEVTYVTADGETNASSQSPLANIQGPNTDQVVMMVGVGNWPIPSGVTSVKFYLTSAPGGVNLGLLGSVASGAFVNGAAIFQFSAPGDNAHFAPASNGTVNSSTAATIWRAREGSTAVAHANGKVWGISPTRQDHDRANQDWLTLPAGYDDAWLRAQWDSPNKLYWGFGIGSSIFQGGRITSNWMTTGYWPLLLSTISARSGITRAGDLYSPTYSTAWTANFIGTPPWNMLHTVNQWTRAGMWITARHDVATNTPNTTPIMLCTSPSATVQSLEVYYYDPPGASGTVGLVIANTGQSSTATPTDTIPLVGDGALHVYTKTGLSSGTWTVNVISQPLDGSSHGEFFCIGVGFYQTSAIPTSGIAFGWFGATGMTLHTLAAPQLSNAVSTDPLSFWGIPTNAAAPYTWGSVGALKAPSMLVFDMINDTIMHGSSMSIGSTAPFNAYGYGPGMYEHKLRQLVAAVRAGQPNPQTTVWLNVINAADGITSQVPGSPDGDPYSYGLWHDALARISRADNCALFNIYRKWLNDGPGQTYQNWGDDHPLDPGHVDIANGMTLSGGL